MDPKEANINYFMHGSKNEHCVLHCNVKSQVDKIIKRNPNYISVQENGGEWMVTYPRNEVRPPYMWIKKRDESEEDEVEVDE